VIAALGFFDTLEVFVKFGLLWKSNAVNTGELFVFFIPTPVCTCNCGKLNGLDKTGVRDVWATAEVCEVSLCVKSNAAVW